jgi:adenosylmethionine-8-amino-7-oxononanoate aminotransferase
MATMEERESTLQELAKRHLWLHFSRMGAYANGSEMPVIVRGKGCHVWDEHGRRYFDGLSALFCVNIGHGRADVAQAGARQAEELGFFTNWSYAHPPSIELAARIAALAPGDLNRVFFTSGGSEAVETTLKLARQYHKLTGNPTKTKVIAREIAYHGTSLGALSATGITALRAPFEPFAPGGGVKQPPGYFQRVREICDEYDVLMVSDEVICSWGRLGTWFGAQRYDYQPDVITTAKGITSAYAPLGAVIASDRVAEPFMGGTASFLHGFTFAGHPMSCAIALANIEAMESEGVLENVQRNEPAFREMLDGLRDIPIVGDVRGAGYFHAIELVKDRDTKATFDDDESEWLLRGLLSGALYEAGLICRADDRGDPVVQLSPPLIAGPEEFAEIESKLRPVLEEAARRLR